MHNQHACRACTANRPEDGRQGQAWFFMTAGQLQAHTSHKHNLDDLFLINLPHLQSINDAMHSRNQG